MDKCRMTSRDLVQDNIDAIGQLFPNCLKEVQGEDGKPERGIDFEVLKQELSRSVIEGRPERYEFNWPGKRAASLTANTPIKATLRPCRKESVNFDTTENLYIEGDNLDVLKLLCDNYRGKIKMIYIDPPYNTGNDFIYEDDFAQTGEEYRSISGDYDDQGNRLAKNTTASGRFHTDWLNMMYPRVRIAQKLLSEDGAIFISLDDNEIKNLIKICDEIFGENNRVGLMTIMSNPRGSQNSKYLSNIHEYILMYAKRISHLLLKGISKSENSLEEFRETDDNGRKYRLLGLRKRGGAWRKEERPNMHYPIYVDPVTGRCSLTQDAQFSVTVIPQRPTGELGRWTWGIPKFEKQHDELVGKKINRTGENDAWDIFRKDYIDNADGEEKGTKIKTIWSEKETNYQNAKNEIKDLFGNSEIFDFPKPTYIIKKLASSMGLDDGDYVLDFFSGSATTAQAIIQLNADAGLQSHFIMVQLPEQLNSNTTSGKIATTFCKQHKLAENICSIGKERIRRAGAKIAAENATTAPNLDIGFRVLKLDSSNMTDVYYSPDELKQEDLFGQADNVKEGRTAEDLLFQVMLEKDIPLSSKIETEIVAGKTIFNVAGGYLLACFDKGVTDEVVTAIAKKHPVHAVFRDAGMATDSTAINFEQIFASYSPDTKRAIL